MVRMVTAVRLSVVFPSLVCDYARVVVSDSHDGNHRVDTRRPGKGTRVGNKQTLHPEDFTPAVANRRSRISSHPARSHLVRAEQSKMIVGDTRLRNPPTERFDVGESPALIRGLSHRERGSVQRLNSLRTRREEYSRGAAHSLAQHGFRSIANSIIDDGAASVIRRHHAGRSVANQHDEERFLRTRLHFRAVSTSTEPGCGKRDQPGMCGSCFDSKPVASLKSCELVAHNRLRRALPRRNSLVEHRAHAGGRMQMEIASEMRQPETRAHQQSGSVKRSARGDNHSRLYDHLVSRPLAGRRSCVNTRDATVLDDDTIGAAARNYF